MRHAALLPLLFALSASAEEPDAALKRLVSLAPAERAKTARELAARKEITLAQWLAAMRSFGSFAPASGSSSPRVSLPAAGQQEPTQLHVHVPASYRPDRPAPLLLYIHGTGGNGSHGARWWRPSADALGMILLCPSESGPNVGYTFADREREISLGAVRWARQRYNIDENRIYATGMSRGGHASWDLALRFPGTFAAIAPMIGGPRLKPASGHNNIRYLENVVTPALPIRDLQGSRDDQRLVATLRDVFAKLKTLGASEAKLLEFPQLGHHFDFAAVDWKAFFGKSTRDPVPKRIVRMAARKGEGRAFWVEVTSLDRKIKHELRVGVPTKLWNSLDAAGRRAYVQKKVDEKTARLEIRMTAPGVFTAKGKGVKRFRLLLTSAMLGKGGAVEVTFNGRKKKKSARPSKRVLLLEFAERFDRTFLPVAEVTLP